MAQKKRLTRPNARPGDARRRAVCCAGAAMFALLGALGLEAQRLMASGESARMGTSDPLRLLFTAALLFLAAIPLLGWMLATGEKRADRRATGERPFATLRAFFMILLCYAPMFVIAFPGTFAYDVPFQLRQVFTGAYSTHHPLLHTLLLGGCVALGRLMGSVNLGAALYTALQAAGLAGCFALTCASIARQCGDRAARRAAVFFALYPLHMVFAVNATKDVLFSGLFALTLALLREAVRGERLTRREAARLCACAAAMLLLRNNAVYAVLAWILLAAIPAVKRRRGAAVGAMTLSVVLALGANALLAHATSAQPGDLSEMLSWPIQQLARARLAGGDALTNEEREAIDELMPGEAWRLYDPTISDPVKFEFDTQALLRDPARYARTYLSVGAKCPRAYFDAVLLHTYSFLCPYGEYRVSGYYVQITVGEAYYDDWCDFERITSAFPRLLTALSWRFGARGAMQIPVIGLLFNMGLIVWTMLYFALREAYEGRWRRFGVALLPVLLLGTFLLGPVMAGRYVYPFVCALPVLASREREG